METSAKHMDKICAILQQTLHWVSRLETLPMFFASREQNLMRTRPQPLLEFILAERRTAWHASAGDRHADIPAGHLALMNAHFGNSGQSPRPWAYFCISFDIDRAPAFDDLAASPMILLAKLTDPRTVARHAAAVIREAHRSHPLQPFALKARVIDWLLAILRSADMDNAGHIRRSPSVERVLDLIADRYMHATLSLESLAASAHLSPDHLGRIFRREMGTSPMRYLTDYRLDRARDLLDKGQLSIKQVAAAVGYTDPLYFSRQFRDRIGCAPSQVAHNSSISSAKGPHS